MTDHASLPPERRPGRQAIIWIVKILVSGGLLYLLLSRVDLHRLWLVARTASLSWLTSALALYFVMVVVSAWRWGLLLGVQQIDLGLGALTNSFLVATFFNNFLPSNIGGDVVRIRDTARQAGSKTLATTVVLLDRGIGLLGLLFVAAVGATLAARRSEAIGPIGPGLLWAAFVAGTVLAAVPLLLPHAVARLLRPLSALHQEWVGERIGRLTDALAKFRRAPGALLQCAIGAIVVQGLLVAFYAAIARALNIPIPVAHLAILVPLSFVIQMAPLSVNGFGIREATFGLYFTKLQLPLESALALSFIGAALVMLFSTSGAIAYLMRRSDSAGAPRTVS